MELYLMRHGQAEAFNKRRYPDDDRPLTEDGRYKLKKASAGMHAVIDNFDIILTSPLLRAKETAQIVAKSYNISEKIKIDPRLKIGAKFNEVVSMLFEYQQYSSVLLVGHEPDLSTITSYLLGSANRIVEFKKGSLCRVDLGKFPLKKEASLIYQLRSKHLEAIGGYFTEDKLTKFIEVEELPNNTKTDFFPLAKKKNRARSEKSC